ncbi:MAG: hypothetical protein JSW58_08140 [Candidatus Latescibacterota bacterium]|nr:MAG: hypothetical protein JSW58_08140 [Candidatus Latescibacterota bacterium]
MAKKSKEELEWEAQADLEALKRVEEMQSDRSRLARAKTQAKKELAEMKKKERALQKVSRKKVAKKRGKK